MKKLGWISAAAVLATAIACVGLPAQAQGPAPKTTQSKHHFSAAARSFSGAKTVDQRVAKLDAAMSGLPVESTAYHADTLWNSGITGTGASVATVVSFGDPKVKDVLDKYSSEHGLPPADLDVIAPAGAIPSCDAPGVPKDDCEGWAGETDLDVTMIHTMAPNARIVVAATPVAETQGFTGLPEMMQAVDYLTTHKIADVISFSFGTTEENFPSMRSIKTLDPALARASKAGVTLVASTGDDGATGGMLYGDGTYPYRVASWPASDPHVTALGGTVLNLDDNGTRTGPDSLVSFSGGGLSKAYQRPAWQNGVAAITKSTMRSFPDITMEGIEGTSQSAPLFAGTLALAVQANHGKRLGQINPALYRELGPNAAKSGIVDVTDGDNGTADVQGFDAAKGFDVVSGWGTIDASQFVPALVKAVR